MDLLKAVLVIVPERDEIRHIDFLEGSEHRCGILGILQALGNSLPHTGELHPVRKQIMSDVVI